MSIKDTYEWYELAPCDAWFFRDGRPMNRGEDARGVQSLFPPSLETIVGAFRAALARSHGWKGYGDWSQEIKDVLGDGFDELGKLSFLGLLLSKDGKPLFPCPKHLLLTKKDSRPADWLSPSEPMVCDLGDNVCLPLPPQREVTSEKFTESDGYFLTLDGFSRVLKGELPTSDQLIKASSLYVFETRVGIFRDEQTRTVGEASLYNPTFVRLRQGVGLLVGLSGLPKEWTIPSLLPLGGESRMARCSHAKNPLQDVAGDPKGELLLSVTPTIAESEHWYGPTPGQDGTLLNSGLSCTIKTVACDRPLLVPSWDSIKGHPRDQLLAIPPGSVWWLSSPDNRSAVRQIGRRRGHGYGLVVPASSPKVLAKG